MFDAIAHLAVLTASVLIVLLAGWDWLVFVAAVVLLVLLADGCYRLGVEDGFNEGASSATFAARVHALAAEDRPAGRTEG